MPSTEYEEYFLHPGDYLFLEGATRARTILGSCVAVTFWHPRYRAGAICHYMMPGRSSLPGPVDGRYGDEVLRHIIQQLRFRGWDPREVQVKLFGGSTMLQALVRQDGASIGGDNVEIGRALLAAEGFRVLKEDVGLCRHRNILFDLETGSVWLRRNEGRCERKCMSLDGSCPYSAAAS